MGSSLFQGFREDGGPSDYGDNKWPVTADVRIYGIIYGFVILTFSLYIAIIGVRGIDRLYVFVRITVGLFIGAVILVCNFGYGWECGSVEGSLQYKALMKENVKAEIGIKVGLRGVNITLLGIPKKQLNNETINYNERFSWEWEQGKPGFGPEAGRFNREFRSAQTKGLPYPILWAAQYFTIDEGNFRHGRYYRTAGWYGHIIMWMAFPLWLLSCILFFMVIRYGAYFLALTGSCLLLTNILFSSIRNAVPLVPRFDSKPLHLHYSWCYYLVLITGILCLLLAAVILFMDLRHPEVIATFFGIDILHDYEDFYADPVELGTSPPTVTTEASTSEDAEKGDQQRSSQELFVLRKRTVSTRLSRFQRASQKRPIPLPRKMVSPEQPKEEEGEGKPENVKVPVYENINLTRFDPIGEEEEPKFGSQEQIFTKDKKTEDDLV